MNQLLIMITLLFATSACCKEDAPCIERIEEDCACITVYDPVCGCNGKTYSNSCEAECSGITDYAKGSCGD